MEHPDLNKSPGEYRQKQGSRPYIAPAAARLSPEEAKSLLLRSGDGSDPVVRQMLAQIDKILRGDLPH